MKTLPAVDLRYWATILSACTMGETVADFMSHGPLNLGYGGASLILLALVCLALLAERSARVDNEARYWTTIVIMSTAGTTLADYISRTLDLGYFWGTVLLALLFAATLYLWRSRASRSRPGAAATAAGDAILPHVRIPAGGAGASVLPHVDVGPRVRTTPATDARYWAAIMVASTLGTTLGDSLTNGTALGFGGGSLLLAAMLAVVLVVEQRARVANQARYWTALVLASTIGATSGDYLTKEEGLDLGYALGIGSLVAVFVAVRLVGRRRAPARRRAR